MNMKGPFPGPVHGRPSTSEQRTAALRSRGTAAVAVVRVSEAIEESCPVQTHNPAE